MPATPTQPTSQTLVWGRREDAAHSKFRARSAVIESLIARWATPGGIGGDISGGAGRWLTLLAPHFSQFWHLDLSRDALEVARRDHPEFTQVRYESLNLLDPPKTPPFPALDTLFCLDTLLYRDGFVETVLGNLRAWLKPQGVAILEFPMRFRSRLAAKLKGARYNGPQRTFTPEEARRLAQSKGFEILDTAYQYRELPEPVQRALSRLGLTAWLPIPSTWMCLVVRKRADLQ